MLLDDKETRLRLARLVRAAHDIESCLHKKPGYVIYTGNLDETEELSEALLELDPDKKLATRIEDEVNSSASN